MKKKQKEKKNYEMVFDFINRVNKVNSVVAFNYVKQFRGCFSLLSIKPYDLMFYFLCSGFSYGYKSSTKSVFFSPEMQNDLNHITGRLEFT